MPANLLAGVVTKRLSCKLHPPQDAVALLEGKWFIEKNIEPPVPGYAEYHPSASAHLSSLAGTAATRFCAASGWIMDTRFRACLQYSAFCSIMI